MSKSEEIKYSIIVPAYKENENLSPLIKRVFAALEEKKMNKNSELIVVDDNSNDGSEAIVNNLQSEGYNARIIVRKNEKGLSSAVLRGFEEAKGEILLCMDADLQHPPEKVPELLNALKDDVEFAIGTRYGEEGGIDKDWPLYRRVVSKGARLLAAPLTSLSDPMTGFFSITRKAYKRATGVSGLGFKICLELYVKAKIKKHAEISIVFGVRTAGFSKLTGKVIIHYLQHLVQLYWFVYPIVVVMFVLLIFFFGFRLIKK